MINIKKLQGQTAKWYGIPKVKGSQKDYQTVVNSFNTGDYKPVFETKLYNKHGSEYCVLLEVLNYNYKSLKA